MVNEALLLIAPGCPHCATMMGLLGELLKEGAIGRLVMVNIAEQPDIAAKHGVRSVPWLKLGQFEFSGALSRGEIETWLQAAAANGGLQGYLAQQLENGALRDILVQVRRRPRLLVDLLDILRGDDVPLTVRIGISAVVEAFADQPQVLRGRIPEFLGLLESGEAAVRADACHFLGLTGSAEARSALERCLHDPEPMVREIARESLDLLGGN